MEHTYSVLPLMEDHFEERIADIVDQYKRKITSCPLFLMKLVPEGNPVWDKADTLCKIYARYRDVLKKEGVPSAILVQATFGHGNALETPASFQRMIGFNNGVEENVYCPIDPSIIEYLSKAMKRIAQEHPKAIMLDDDVRLLMRPFEGCACPYHMKEFNRMNNTDMTRAELLEYVKKHPKNDALTASFERLQTQSLVNAVKAFRTAIDSVDPSIQGINCTSGDECDSVIYTNPVFAGKNNPTIVRAPNGTYAPLTTKGFSDTMRRAAVCGAKLRGNGIDIVLAETDTVPFNRYAKNARYLHAHFTASILEGLKGAKHWLTRTSGYEPKSGVAFRNILAEHSNYYEEVAKLADGLRWVGANSAFIEQKHHVFCVDNIWCYNPLCSIENPDLSKWSLNSTTAGKADTAAKGLSMVAGSDANGKYIEFTTTGGEWPNIRYLTSNENAANLKKYDWFSVKIAAWQYTGATDLTSTEGIRQTGTLVTGKNISVRPNNSNGKSTPMNGSIATLTWNRKDCTDFDTMVYGEWNGAGRMFKLTFYNSDAPVIIRIYDIEFGYNDIATDGTAIDLTNKFNATANEITATFTPTGGTETAVTDVTAFTATQSGTLKVTIKKTGYKAVTYTITVNKE